MPRPFLAVYWRVDLVIVIIMGGAGIAFRLFLLLDNQRVGGQDHVGDR